MSQSSTVTIKHLPETQSFDLFRLAQAKKAVGLCVNTLRKFHRQGLPFYRQERSVFISRRELELFLRKPVATAKAKNSAKRFTEQARQAAALATKARSERLAAA